MKDFLYFETGSVDPAYNLAAEEYLFERLSGEEPCLMLWQNDRTIVVGKHQNTAEEINAAYVRDRDIRVVRRLSGGGAVYHDLGNLNYTLITKAPPSGQLDLSYFCHPVIETLASFGVRAEVSGRNDMTLDGKKFSGNSQYIRDGRLLHHGTLMFDSDLTVLGQALKVSRDKYESKGLKSVRSRVTNLRDYLPEEVTLSVFKEALARRLAGERASAPYVYTEADLAAISDLKKSRYETWEWNYGRSPAYALEKKRRIEGVGTLTLSLNVEKGRIRDLALSGDFFGEGLTEALSARLKGCALEEEAVRTALKGASAELEKAVHHLGTEDLTALLLY